MKNLLIKSSLAFIIWFTYSLSFAQSPASDIQDLGNTIVTSLKNNDFSAFMQAHLSEKDLDEFVKKQSASTTKKREHLKEVTQQSLEDKNKELQKRFETIIQKGIAEQINWKEVEFSRIENTTDTHSIGKLSIITNPVIVFAYRNKEQKIPLQKIALLDRGWVVIE